MVSISNASDSPCCSRAPQQIAQHHGGSRQQTVRRECRVAAAVDMLRRKLLAEPQDQRAIADGAGKTDPVGRVGRDEHGMARRADHLPAGRIVLGEHAGQRQHHGIRSCRSTSPQASESGRATSNRPICRVSAFKQCFTA